MDYYLRKNWKRVLLPALLTILSSVIFTLWQLGLMQTFDAAARLELERFLFWIVVELAGISLNYGVLILENWIEARAVRDLNNQVRHDLYLSLMGRSHAAYHSQDTGEYISWLTTNIKQIDFSFQWPLMKDLYGLGRYNYSFRDKKVVDSLMGLEYRAGCWILRGAVQRYIRSEGRSTTNFFLELELVGLGTVGSSPIQALSEGITGYKPIGPKPVEVGRYDYYE